jgi:hypothetical protein
MESGILEKAFKSGTRTSKASQEPLWHANGKGFKEGYRTIEHGYNDLVVQL